MSTQFSMSEVLDIVRRRKPYFIIPFLVISLISMVGAFVLPKRYEAYTTILVQKDDILNPFVEWQKAVALVQIDQLTLLNEILLSRSSIVQLLDSLGIETQSKNLGQMEDLVSETRKKITTEQRGSDSFRIFYADTDPYITQRAATTLSNIYIQTSLRSNQQQSESVVRFYQQKVDEYQKKFEEEQRALLVLQQERLRMNPLEEGSLRSGLDKVTDEMSENDKTLAQQQTALNLLRSYRENIDDPTTVAKISALDAQGAALYITDLKALAVKYTDLLSRYTPRYPQVQSVRTQLINLVEKATQALETEITGTKSKRARLEASRNETMGGISKAITGNEIGAERKSGYIMVKELYDTMRQKLETARIAKELGARGASKYVILDAAQVPSAPTKPKKGLIIGGGAALGLIIGIAAMFAMEYYDPTIRRRQDIEVFNKPIIGYLP